MKVYLVYENDGWEGHYNFEGIYSTKEKASKRVAEIILKHWDDFMNNELEDYNKQFNTHLTREQFATVAAKEGGYDESGSWEEKEVQ